jgi:hypothetical protein
VRDHSPTGLPPLHAFVADTTFSGAIAFSTIESPQYDHDWRRVSGSSHRICGCLCAPQMNGIISTCAHSVHSAIRSEIAAHNMSGSGSRRHIHDSLQNLDRICIPMLFGIFYNISIDRQNSSHKDMISRSQQW